MRLVICMITLAAAVALSAGCSSSSSGSPDPAAATTTGQPVTPTRAVAVTGVPSPSTTFPPTTRSTFCASVRRLGLDNLGIAQDPGSAPNDLLPNLDKLDAIAPPSIRADFDRFTRLEHALLAKAKPDPGALANLNSPDAARSLRHVGNYLRVTCGIGTS